MADKPKSISLLPTTGGHTPGPWKVRFFHSNNKDTGDNNFFVEAKNNNKPELGYGIEIMMEDFGDHNGYPREQRLADARLIAAAPLLLETLIGITAIEPFLVNDDKVRHSFKKHVWAAIEAATGPQ